MSTMTDSETYNGYANRETWAFNLHWQNDQGLYNETLEQAGDLVQRKSIASLAAEPPSAFEVGDYIVNYWRDFIDDMTVEGGGAPGDTLRMFDREVGSWWRVNRAEVGEAVLESLDIES